MKHSKLIESLGILALIAGIVVLFRLIKDATDTKLYSEDAISKMGDEKEMQKLDALIEEYHK